MKIKVLFSLIFLMMITVLWPLLQQTETVPGSGMSIVTQSGDATGILPEETQIIDRDVRVDTRWQTADPAAICGDVCVSSVLQTTFAEWHLNNERVELFYDTNTPLWSYGVADLDFGFPIDMLDDGTHLAVGDDTVLKLFGNESATPTWEFPMQYTIKGVKLSITGDSVFVAYYDGVHNAAYLECYETGNTTPLWSVMLEGGMTTFTCSDDRSTLVLTQYGGGHETMWVLDAEDGTILFDAPSSNQNPPALSYDGSVIVNGDYSGYVYLYTWDDQLLTYNEQWRYHVGGGGSSAWIGGMAVSGDGSTVAVGTLVFISGGYDGEVYLFDVNSPTPRWVFEHAGDYVLDCDLTYDGEMLATAGYGPMDQSTADFMLFRRESNIPVFEINTPGSLFCVDLAEDGSFCATGGKAVHAREMGSGGTLYTIDCNLGGGFVSGMVNLDGCDDNSGVKVSVASLDDYYDYSDASGAFLIEHVPAGSYNLDYNKVGYVPGNQGVVVVEGQTTSVDDQTLYSWGAPPSNLTASQEAGPWVALNWDAPASGTVEGYNVYRKRYSIDPYPEEPLAVVGADETTYLDESAFPGVEYYYVVTAKVMTQYQTPYSNEAMGWNFDGFVTDNISVYVGSTPTIDGIISPGEWDDAFALDTSDFCGAYDNAPQPIGSVMGYYKTNADMTELYVAYINMNDTELEDHDEVALYIDDNNDGLFPEAGDDSEGNYWAAYYAAGNQLKYRPIYNTGGVGNVIFLDNPQVEVSAASGYVVYEFMIPMGNETWEITPSADNQSSLAIFVLDDNSPNANDFDGWWPFNNTDLFAPMGFGTITYGTTPQTPPAPGNLSFEILSPVGNLLQLSWDCTPINNFDHFNVYASIDGAAATVVGECYGLNYQYECGATTGVQHSIFITLVNQSGMESDPSNTVEYVTVGSGTLPPAIRTSLDGNYPNPFNPTTTIGYSLQNPAMVTLEIYNIRGQKVRTLVQGVQQAGMHTALWDGKDETQRSVSSGIYFYKMNSSGYEKARKMILLK